MSRRVLVGFVIVNVIVSLVVALGVISYDRSRRPDEPSEGPTQIVILTATPIPGLDMQPAEYQSTIDTLQLTSTALAQDAARINIITATPPENADIAPTITAVATIDPAILPPVPTDLPPGLPSPTPQNDGCARHVIESGDTIIAIAQQYGVFPGDILTVNAMTEDDAGRLQIGDVLIIPVAGCASLLTPTAVPVPTNTPFALSQAAATVTLPPTAINAQIVIATVEGVGNVNSEMVEVRNVGNVINMAGWTLSNARGNEYTFPELRIQRDGRLLIFSRQGSNTPAALYWGRENAAWRTGDTVTLSDSAGEVQATFTIGVDQPLFQD